MENTLLFMEMLEQLSGTLVRLERENTRGVNYDLRGSDNVSYIVQSQAEWNI